MWLDILIFFLIFLGIVDIQNQWALSTTVSNSTSNNNRPISKSASSTSSLFAMQQQQDFVLVGNDDSSQSEAATPANFTLTALNSTEPKNKSTLTSQQNSRLTPVDISLDDSHLNKLRQLLGAGQKSDAIELAVKYNMWPHALFLASSFNAALPTVTAPNVPSSTASVLNEKYKALNKVKNRFINSLQVNDPIHTCYQLLVGRIPAVATVKKEYFWQGI